MTATIRERVQTFRTSSAFSAGDPFSFGVILGKDLKLPGKHDAADYMKRLDVVLKDRRVCIVCPGNGGLCVEALNAGAAAVTAYEPRPVYQKALTAVAGFTSDVLDRSFSVVAELKDSNVFDIVIWSEGLDDLKDPKHIIEAVIGAVAPGGTLYLEVAHGTGGVVPDRINAWRPTKDGLLGTLKAFSDIRVAAETAGRNQVRKIYTIQNTKEPVRHVHVDLSKDGDRTGTVTVTPLGGQEPTSSDAEDVEYFRKNLMASIAKMREKSAETAPATSPSPEAPTPESHELAEVFDRPAEPEAPKASTPKSKRKTDKDSKS